MNKLVAGILMVASLLGCSKTESETVRLRMEVGYPMLGDLGGGPPRLWAIYRFQGAAVSDLNPGDAVVAILICEGGAHCAVERVEKKSDSLPVNHPLWINGRVLQVAQGDGGIALILEPFPIRWAGRMEQVEFKPGETKLVEAHYLYTNERLVFKQLDVIGATNRSPVSWK